MATILEFRTAGRAASSMARSGTPAEIVFFPGVRYERWSEPSPAAKQKKRAKKRDKIEVREG